MHDACEFTDTCTSGREFREVRFVETFRLYGAGYKVRARVGASAWKGGIPPGLSRRWWRHWLVLTSPYGPYPLPWIWWFSAGRAYPVRPEHIAILEQEVLDRFWLRVEKDQVIQISDMELHMGEEWFERYVLEPWVSLHLQALRARLGAIVRGSSPLDVFVEAMDVPTSATRIKLRKSYRYVLIFRLYDRMTNILKKPVWFLS